VEDTKLKKKRQNAIEAVEAAEIEAQVEERTALALKIKAHLASARKIKIRKKRHWQKEKSK
jgi:hypothetical protein|tara:strand:+ start:393 stop:575 length:183 start_codon:yes stop_codon:yes gene_type:complete